jgi:hypothetical protein
MKTRNQTKYEQSALFEVDIDFDYASEAWKSNKISIGNGSYKYVCKNTGITGKSCTRKCLAGEEYCSTHKSTSNAKSKS